MEETQIVDKAKDFWAKFSNQVIYIGSAVIIIGGLWLGYRNFIQEPKMAKADDLIFPVEGLFDKMSQTGFSKDSINIVLNGGTNVAGVLKIASTYGSTPAGNRAKYIAGACYLHNGDYANAVKFLKEFSTNATQVQSAAYSMLGDAYAELNNNDDAFTYYKKSATVNDKDEFSASEGYFKAALFAQATGKTSDAVELFQKVKDDYPNSAHAKDIDKYLAQLGVLN
ncbi:MAG TPA: tetratricopeptide repeat protein [Bacteroidia bacterium]|jgi:TolA-binding protein|nr:tetratricopeptide repeat protein [Bacteroidia bacterium]